MGLIRALAGIGGLCLLFCVAGLAVELPRGADSGGPLTDPSHWRRWLPERSDAGDLSLPVIAPLPPLTMAAGDPIRQRFMDQAFVQKWASGPASLPWNRLALELIVKYQQNPLRAARVLAHLHAAAHDCICLLFSSQLDCIMFIVSSSYQWAEGVRFSRRPSSRWMS